MRLPDAMVGGVFEPAWDLYDRSCRLRELSRLRRSQWDGPETVGARQQEKLRAIIRHAAETCAYYRDRWAAAGIDAATVRTVADLRRLPILTKDDIRQHQDALVSSRYRKQDLRRAKTGGSTGVSLEVYCDEPGIQKRAAAALRSDEWSGWRLGQPMAAAWGNPPVPRTWKARLRARLKDRIIYLDTMRIDEPAIVRFLAEWDRLRPGLLFGHAHSLFILAEYLLANGRTLRPSGIVATSMMLLEPERRVIEQACAGVPVTNRYGCEEVSLIACECEQHRGLHLNADHVITEFLRDDGSPCAPGEDGRLVVTELINHGQPLIRYELGDRGVPSDRACPCGRGLPLMEQVTGRTADFLRAEGGYRVQGISIIENTLTKLPGIRQMQIVQEEPLRLRVHLVPGPGWGADVAAELETILRGILGPGMVIDLVPGERIPQEKNGKYRFTICRV
ncbi:MAG: phenylacetate--CoA ligase family protein [bacterium]|nr:phenylacetate--CoA ligase family protein [bacterium]